MDLPEAQITPSGGRRGRDQRHSARSAESTARAVPYIIRNIPPYDILSEEALLRTILKSAPACFVQHARNPARSVLIGGESVVFSPAYGSSFFMDLDQGRRYGTIADFENFVKLAQSSPWLRHSGGTPEAAIGFTTSKLPDGQAMMEGVTSQLAAVHCGANFILHSAGFLDGLLSMSYEKFVMDADYCGALHVYLTGVSVDDNALALDAFKEVGVGNHFFGCAHTRENYETAFYDSQLSDNETHELWSERGADDMMVRANRRWKKMLAEYVPPPLDAGVDEALRAFIARKKAAIPDAWH